MPDITNEVICSDCGSVPVLHEVPYEGSDYVVTCDCEQRSVDVSESVNGVTLVDPLTGKWSNIDHDYECDTLNDPFD